MDLLSVFKGVTTPLSELTAHLDAQGWALSSVDFKKDRYVAKATSLTDGDTLERFGPDDASAVANLLIAVTRRNHMRSPARTSAWDSSWTNQIQEIAEAYSKMPVYDPKAAGGWKELADDSVRRMAILGQQLQIEVTDEPEPYSSVQEMCEDIHNRQHFYVSRANADHPVWTVEQNVAFRVVHDVMGHCVSGGSFDWVGENQACAAHFPLLSPEAQRALFTECIGQTGYAGFYRSFGPQKVGYMDEFLADVQSKENPAAHQGIHPSQTIAPTSVPAYSPDTRDQNEANPRGYVAPHMEGLGLTPVMTKTAGTVLDPNHAWQSGIEPHPDHHAIVHYGDPLEHAAVKDNASLVDTGWSTKNPEDPGDRALMKQAIVNAFRVVLLSPRKDLRWNAIHYQDISHIPADVKDPKVYWDTLEQARQHHNGEQARKLYEGKVSPETLTRLVEDARVSHQEWRKFWPNFFNVVYQQVGDYQKALEKAERMAMEWQTQEHERLELEDRDKDPAKQNSADALERKATKAMVKRMQAYIKDFQPSLDFAAAVQQTLDIPEQEAAPEEQVDRYGAFMGTHLKSIGQISQYADALLDAAVKDVQEQDGAGHHFRAEALKLGVPGVGPKVASFAWLLLQPMTSQLATIDTHMMDVLGHNYEKEMNNRDYFKFERELQAGRDAAGYQHVPLGQFQWGMWDHKRTGPGTHQDHSAMRVLDPVPHQTVDWAAKADNLKAEDWHNQAPEWWLATQPAREQVAQHFDETLGGQVPRGQVPWTVQNEAHTAGSVDDLVNELAGMYNPPGKSQWWKDRIENAPKPQPPRNMIERRGVTLKDGTEHWWDASEGPHVQWLFQNGVHPSDVHDYHTEMTNGDRHNLKEFYPTFHADEYQRLESQEPEAVAQWRQFTAKLADSDFSKGFAHWWNKEKPHKVRNAAKMAEYAAGTRTSKADVKKFIESHKSDVEGSWKDFEEAFWKKYDRLNKSGAALENQPDWEVAQDDADANSTARTMADLKERTGLTTIEIWRDAHDASRSIL